MTAKEFEENFMTGEEGFSITIKRHTKFKCISTWQPDWHDGICFVDDRVTTAGNNHHPHANEKQFIPETRIHPELIDKIKQAIVKVILDENIIIE